MTVNSSSKIKLQSHLLALSPNLSQQQIKEIQPENYFLNKFFPLGDITPIKKKKKGFTDDKYIGLSGTVIPFHLLHLPSGGVLLCKLPLDRTVWALSYAFICCYQPEKRLSAKRISV